MAWDEGFEAAFNPRAVAVVGASNTARSHRQGAAFIHNFQKLASRDAYTRSIPTPLMSWG